MGRFDNYLSIKNMSIIEYINTFNNMSNQNTIPKELKNCNCCDNHKIIFKQSKSKSKKLDCTCPCRHVIRILLKQKNIYLEDSDSESLGSQDSKRSSDSDSDSDSFIDKDDDDGISPKVREILDKIKKKMKKN